MGFISKTLRTGLLCLVACHFSTSTLLADDIGVVYRWDATAWLSKYNNVQFIGSPVTNPDGTAGAKIEVTPRDALNPYNFIVSSPAGLKGGNPYTAVITFSVSTPTTYPTNFFIFARNSAGEQYDIWQTWIGLPGPTRTIAVPLDLKDIPNGIWRINMGISKAGGLIVNSFVVYSGITSDGKTPYIKQEAATSGTPASELPPDFKAATGFTPFTIAPPAETKGPVISMASYPFIADTAGAPPTVATANAVSLQKALADCKAQGASKLLIPKGNYRIEALNSIRVDGLADFTLDGQGSRVIFEKLTKDGPAFTVIGCSRTLITNLALDWDWNSIPIASLGVVSNLSPDKLQCDFTFPDLDATATALTLKTPWRGIFPMDPVHLLINADHRFSIPKTTTLTAGSAPNVIHAVFPTPVPLQEGTNYCVRHLYYEMGGFKTMDNQDLLFQNCDIYSIPGMGWFFGGSMKNFGLLDCHILRDPGSRHPLTTAADGIHVDQSEGNAIFENCTITGTGDDEFNVHSEVYQANLVADPANPAKVTLENCPSYQLRLKEGDTVEFFNADFSNLNGSATPVSRTIAKVTSNNKGKGTTVIEFTEPLPEGLTPQSIVQNGRLATRNVHIENCTMSYSGGRGILLSAQGALISNCHFDHVFAIPIDLESEIVAPLWTEGRGASNVVIKGNTFQDCNQMGRYGGATIYTNTRIPYGPCTTTLYDRITIEDNRFFNSPGPVLSVTNTANLVFRSNEIHSTENLPNATEYEGTILALRSSNLALGGNTWFNEVPSGSGVVYDPATTSGVSLGVNVVTNSAAPAPTK